MIDFRISNVVNRPSAAWKPIRYNANTWVSRPAGSRKARKVPPTAATAPTAPIARPSHDRRFPDGSWQLAEIPITLAGAALFYVGTGHGVRTDLALALGLGCLVGTRGGTIAGGAFLVPGLVAALGLGQRKAVATTLPGGYVYDGQNPEEVAALEVEEETGWRPGQLERVMSFQPLVGTVDSENILFLARGAQHLGPPPDVDEAEQVAWVPLRDALEMIPKGEILGSATVIGLLALVTQSA